MHSVQANTQRETRLKTHHNLILAILALFAVAIMACSGGTSTTATPTTKAATTTTPAATATATFAADSSMAAIVKKGKITIGVKYDVPLFGLLDPTTKKVDGFDVAIGKEIAKALGLKEEQIEFVEAITANRIPYLQQDKA